MVATLQQLPRDAEVLAFVAGCEQYCERDVDKVDWRAAVCSSTSVPAATTHRLASLGGSPDWQSPWQSDPFHRIGRDATRRLADRM
jgi:hypothetical protein